MKVNEKRLMERLYAIGEIGKTEDGIQREAFDKKYYEALKKLKKVMEEEGLTVTIDKIGNIYGLRKGNGNSEEVVLIGSHMDTVKNGGLYDGNLGVQAALECISVLNDNKIKTEHDVVVAGFNAEEGGPLGGTFGSRVACGNQRVDMQDINEKLRGLNLTVDSIKESKIPFKPMCFLELHIEQGIQLYNDKINIGIVEGIVGITRYKITVTGEQNHAGTTPMKYRKDALVAASGLITQINDLAQKQEESFVATIGKMDVSPNAVNVISETATMILEIRHIEKNIIDSFMESVRKKAETIQHCKVIIEPYSHKDSVYLSDELNFKIEEICSTKNIKNRRMYSGAGHDAMELSKIAPTALIFIPSKDGISHNNKEFSEKNDIIQGVSIMLEMVMELSK